MSLALIQQFYGLAGSGRFDEALGLFAEDARVQFNGPREIPLSGVYEGHAGIQRFFGIVAANVQVELFEALEFIDGGATVAVVGHERSSVKSTGKRFDVPWVQVWRVRDGRIAELVDFFDTGSMTHAFQN
jgi:ketosteroid isomerase-like protein